MGRHNSKSWLQLSDVRHPTPRLGAPRARGAARLHGQTPRIVEWRGKLYSHPYGESAGTPGGVSFAVRFWPEATR